MSSETQRTFSGFHSFHQAGPGIGLSRVCAWKRIERTSVPRRSTCLHFRTGDPKTFSLILCIVTGLSENPGFERSSHRTPKYSRARFWSLGFLVQGFFAEFASTAFIFIRIVSRILTGLGTIFFVLSIGLVSFFYCRDSVCVFNYKASFCLFLGSEKEEIPERLLREILIYSGRRFT